MLDAIRNEGASFNWIEEQRFEWTAITKHTVSQLLEGKTAILLTDERYKWFEHYISSSINSLTKERPLVSVVALDRLHYESVQMSSGQSMQMLLDLLELSFADRYFFWYIGKGSDPRSEIAKSSTNSTLWIMNEEYPNSIHLSSYDPKIDIELLQLYRLFELSLNAALFGEVEVDE